jgi:hypothetical protein
MIKRGEDVFLINIHRFRHPISTIRIKTQIKIPVARSTKCVITVSKVTPFGRSTRISSNFGVQKFLSIRCKIPDLLMSWILCVKTKIYFIIILRVLWKNERAYFATWIPMFRRNRLTPSSGRKVKEWKQVPPQNYYRDILALALASIGGNKKILGTGTKKGLPRTHYINYDCESTSLF